MVSAFTYWNILKLERLACHHFPSVSRLLLDDLILEQKRGLLLSFNLS